MYGGRDGCMGEGMSVWGEGWEYGGRNGCMVEGMGVWGEE